jgi:hypothetical protein
MGRVVWSDFLGKNLLIIALCLVLLTHGVVIFFTMPKTYDAFVHIFFADHYARFWFEPWEYRWYTGFSTISYPPLVHQMTALLSKLFPLKVAFCIYAILIYKVLVIGVYRFTKLFFDKSTAGAAAILAALLSSIVETVHVYGQIPTMTGLGFLLNALPFLYLYIRKEKFIYLILTLSFLSVTISSHHVTAIFGQVFFIAPTIFMALVDEQSSKNLKENFSRFFLNIIKTAIKKYKQLILVLGGTIILAIGLIFPYWYWSKTDPITQVSIPHGSRDSFIDNFSSGLIFFIIPLALVLALLPAISYKITSHKRYIGWAVSFFLCLLLGTGGTTPIPKLILGDSAFNILTLDRFSFWASIIAIPFMAHFIFSFAAGHVKKYWMERFNSSNHFLLSFSSGFSYFIFLIFIFHLGSFRPLQPKEIEIEPLLNFLNRDDHMRWRYLTLGFGDQMAWLSANTLAATVDGNYHSARRLPELTTRPVERLENAKFAGKDGLASLKDFLSNAEKYNLKYVFSNDRYYDPLLYYNGWSRTIRLENGIMVWEKGNISTIKPLAPKPLSPVLKIIWGVFPILSLVTAIFAFLYYLIYYKEQKYKEITQDKSIEYSKNVIISSAYLPVIFFSGFILFQLYELLYVKEQNTPETTVLSYYNHLDFQRFHKAFQLFEPSPTYPIDQYLLEKSVNDGGILPSYAKLDSIHTRTLYNMKDSSKVEVFTRWNTALGFKNQLDTLNLISKKNKWYIVPKKFIPEIPDEQMRSYTFTLFKKQGKRLISSFPSVKDDRVKKPFVIFNQANIISNKNENYITGEVLNADDIPVNIALRVSIKFQNDSIATFYPDAAFIYNLAPKASSFFQIDFKNMDVLDTQKIKSIELYAETDVSERGYIHGGTVEYDVKKADNYSVSIHTKMYNELSTEINIPGILVAEKDELGMIWQTKLLLHPNALRSGLHIDFQNQIKIIRKQARKIESIPLNIFVNGQSRILPAMKTDEKASTNEGISILPHCFMSQEIYLQ